jgi:hypothetical protein
MDPETDEERTLDALRRQAPPAQEISRMTELGRALDRYRRVREEVDSMCELCCRAMLRTYLMRELAAVEEEGAVPAPAPRPKEWGEALQALVPATRLTPDRLREVADGVEADLAETLREAADYAELTGGRHVSMRVAIIESGADADGPETGP